MDPQVSVMATQQPVARSTQGGDSATAAADKPTRKRRGGNAQRAQQKQQFQDQLNPVDALTQRGEGVASGDGLWSKGFFKPYHSESVPKSVNLGLASKFAARDASSRTTVMLRNIPNRYCQSDLLEEIDAAGFGDKYDFFYLPMDTHNRTNVGYAFINFSIPAHMQEFIKSFSGYRFKDHSSQKIAKVSPAHLQGFYENVQHFSNRAVTHARNSQYRPIVVLDGQRMDLNDAAEQIFAMQFHHASQLEQYAYSEEPASAETTPDSASKSLNKDAPIFTPSKEKDWTSEWSPEALFATDPLAAFGLNPWAPPAPGLKAPGLVVPGLDAAGLAALGLGAPGLSDKPAPGLPTPVPDVDGPSDLSWFAPPGLELEAPSTMSPASPGSPSSDEDSTTVEESPAVKSFGDFKFTIDTSSLQEAVKGWLQAPKIEETSGTSVESNSTSCSSQRSSSPA